MQVGRADEGGDAIMMLAIDNTVESLDFVIATEGVFDAKEIKL